MCPPTPINNVRLLLVAFGESLAADRYAIFYLFTGLTCPRAGKPNASAFVL